MTAVNNKTQQAEELLASFIVGTDYKKLPREVIETSKNAILDLIGVAVAGSSEPPGRILLEEIKESGGQPQSGVIGGGFRTSVTAASLINGTMAHALDYDDISESWTGHPSAVLVPAIMAMGERCHSSGKEILTAYVVGFEVGARLGMGIGKPHYARGWHNTGTIGCIASAAAAAKLLKLNPKKTKMALGVASSLAGGLRANFGTMTKPLHAGNAARNGNLAGLLAKRGFTASEHWLTADSGFSKAFGADSQGLDETLSQLGKQLSILSPGIWLKSYPSCGPNHSLIEAALNLRRQHSLNPENIAEVNLAVPKYVPNVAIHHHPKTGLEGKFSMEYSVSVALIDGEALLSQFTDERVNARDIQLFIPRVKYNIVKELGDKMDQTLPVTISVTLKNGEKLSITENTPTGKPDKPMSPEQLRKKFENCTQILSPEDRTEVVKLVSKLEKLDGIDKLMSLIAGRGEQRGKVPTSVKTTTPVNSKLED